MFQKKKFIAYPQSEGLHDINLERESCGTGFVVSIKRQASRKITQEAIDMLIAMEHRGGFNADPETGDGVGITFSIPHSYFEQIFAKEYSHESLGANAISQKINLPPLGHYGVGNIFFPQDEKRRNKFKQELIKVFEEEGLNILLWRNLKVYSSKIGIEAQACEPFHMQVFVAASKHNELERRLYLARKRATHFFDNQHYPNLERCYICSLSNKTIVYKGMLTPRQLPEYFDDLQQEGFCTFLGMMHSRFSTNTFPSWERAQPFRMMSHNGEINTLYGNQNKMHAREGVMQNAIFQDRLKDLYPVIEQEVSDSGAFDNTLEFLYHNGYSLMQAICMMIPEAWQHSTTMSDEHKAMYEAYSCVMDPWDGPACITFTDGRYIGVVIDRNGLRPSRYYVTKDNMVIMASEFGVLDIDQEQVIKKNRLQPGTVFLIDTEDHRIIDDSEIKHVLSNKHPYLKWIKEQTILMEDLAFNEKDIPTMTEEEVEQISRCYGYSEEDKFFIIKPMIEKGKEPLGSMGNDVALACLSDEPRMLYDYFKQWFAQVTNPPIDSIRERSIMSIGSYIGPEGNLLDMKELDVHRLWLSNPILSHKEFTRLANITYRDWKATTIDITYDVIGGIVAMKKALNSIKAQALGAANAGTQIIILSDRGISAKRVALSTLMALGTVHHHLIKNAARSKSAIVLETGEAREVHHYCMLIGYGADAIFPYLALEHAFLLHKKHLLSKEIKNSVEVVAQYKKAVDYGICKVFAKMGISTIDSYRGAQIFEAVGIGEEVINECFVGTTSRIGGIGFEELVEEARRFHARGFLKETEISQYGDHVITLGNFQWRKRGYRHMWEPESVALVQHAVRYNKQDSFDKFVSLQDARLPNQVTLRGLFRFNSKNSLPLEEVESAEEIMKRFSSGAMSYGSISLEAHETLAIAMNRIGGKSNTGEGGEISDRYKKMENGDWKRSAIKQVASGRFGVTIEYLSNADEIQIKMAQGAKPGEGGELPGRKVFGMIASTRYATAGIELISPPPHHDIYSIEDLAQLIYDLKNANPKARISVKLVAKAGVGVIAAGVTKAKADHILISGHDGGTGASPLTSIKHAGLPWELGIAEAHQVLVRNNLRSRVILQTDGQLKTGRDICIAAMLGAEEFGFATVALIAMGCIMMRKCELNTCPVGVATQDEALRKRFTGSPDHVERLMRFIAEDTRKNMANLGFRTIEEMVGNTDLLQVDQQCLNWKSKTLNIPVLLGRETALIDDLKQCCSTTQNHGLETALDQQIIRDTKEYVEQIKPVELSYSINNTNRATGTMLSHEIVLRYGHAGLPEDTIKLNFNGHAGQSFGAFLTYGVSMTLEGDSNDYTGKGLSGGILSLMPPKKRGFVSEDNIIVGNVVLYGATSGKAFFRGRAAERFCIRNSGAKVVVEGLGVHGCEYMTGGRVVVLGSVDKNFASGMSGGVAYVWDKAKSLGDNVSQKSVLCMNINEYEESEIFALVEEHFDRTQSERAAYLLSHWKEELAHFIKVVSPEFQKVFEIRQQRKKVEVVNG